MEAPLSAEESEDSHFGRDYILLVVPLDLSKQASDQLTDTSKSNGVETQIY